MERNASYTDTAAREKFRNAPSNGALRALRQAKIEDK
jgi:hypothetical protein